MNKINIFFISFLALFSCNSKGQTIYDDVFMSSEHWIVEQQPGGKVVFDKNYIEITDAKGCTIWFKHKLEAPVKIEYDATVIDQNGAYVRVSDLNCF